MSLEQSNPLVTVYIPTFNRVELLKRAVESVRQQTYQNLEIIIVDDCSNDGTHEYLDEISKQDSRIRYFIKEKNSGACVSRNIAIENANGEFITGLDDDDYFINKRIEVFIRNWSDEYSCIFSNSFIKVNNNKLISNKRLAMKKVVEYLDLIKVNQIGNQVFTKTIYLKNIGGFDTKLKMWQDLECWFRLLKKHGIAKRLFVNLYVVDISHSHERITKKKIERVLETYKYFCYKHDLNEVQKKDLYTQVLNYENLEVDNLLYFRKFLNYKTLGNLYLLFNKIFTIKKFR